MTLAYREPSPDSAARWDKTARAEIERELQPGEQLVWCGRPRQGLRLQWLDAFLVPFGLVWCGFVAVGPVMALRDGAPWPFVMFALLFVAVGLHLLAGRFFVDKARRARTYYGVTSRRALIARVGRRRSATSIDLVTQQSFEWRESRGGRGTIVLGTPTSWRWAAQPQGWPGSANGPPTFEEISDARAVFDKMLEAQRAAREETAKRVHDA